MVFGFGRGRREKEEEGRKLFELGMLYASQFKVDEAIEYYKKSLAVREDPAPYINLANLECKRIRYYEALQSLLAAQRVDRAQGKQFAAVIEREIRTARAVSSNYDNGLRDRLIADYRENDARFVAERIICTSFGINELQWKYGTADLGLVEYHLFNEVDNVLKFEKLSDYPEVDEMLNGGEMSYSMDFLNYKLANCPDLSAYQNAELKVHNFLCTYPIEDMRYIRRNMLYSIHTKLMVRDFGDFWDALDSECRGVTKEAEGFMDQRAEA